MNTNTKLASLENKAAAADRLVESACERRRLQHDLLEELRIEKTDIEKSLDLVRQREIELRRRRDSFTTLHRNTSRLLHQAEQGVQQFRKESSTAKQDVDKEIARLRSNRFRRVVWAGFGGPKPYPNFTAEEESAVRQLTSKTPPSKLTGRLFARVPRIYQFVARIREPGPGATNEDLVEEHAARRPQEDFHQSLRNQRYVDDCVDSFNKGQIEDDGDGGESGAVYGLTRRQHEDLRKHIRGGGQVIQETVVVEKEGPGAPVTYTSHRESITHKLHRALGPDKDKTKATARRPRKQKKKPPQAAATRTASPQASAEPEIDLFPDEEDAFYIEASNYVGDINDSGEELENSYAGIVLARFPEDDDVEEDGQEDGRSQADLEELPEEKTAHEDRDDTQQRTPVPISPANSGIFSPEPEPEKVDPAPAQSPKRPQLPDKDAVRKRGRANNVRR